MQKAAILVEEIIQITNQYKAEVGSKRKPWPNSIIQRVNELITLGWTSKKISTQTGIPYFSILNFRQRETKKLKKNFHAVSVSGARPNPVATVTVAVAKPEPELVGTVTVTTPEGYKVEGSLKLVVEAIKSLRGEKCS